MSWLSRLANVLRPSSVDRALDEEIQFHIDSRTDDLVAAGVSREAAEAIARRQFGNRLRVRESSHDLKLLPWLESLVRDTGFAFRILRKDLVVTGAAITSLTVAIGACLAAFSLVDALILRSLPVRDPDRLVSLTFPTYSTRAPLGQSFSYPLFARLRDAARNEVELFATSTENKRRATFQNAEREDEVRVRFVTGNAFPALGVRPAVGRLLRPSDDLSPGAQAVAVLGHAFWRRRLGGDPSVVGSTFTLGEKRFQIIGIAQESFTGIEPGRLVDLWLPLAMYDAKGFTFTNPEWNWLWVLGHLNPGVTPERARDALQATFSQFRRELMSSRQGPQDPPDRLERYVNTPLALPSAANGPSTLRRQFDRPLWILTTLVGLVLLIATSNVANLFLARAAVREREMSLRLSIGASRSRLVQQVLIESALVAAAACLLGLVFARVAAPAIVQMLASSADPVYLDLRVDWRSLGFLCTTGVLTTMLFGLAPALRASGVAPIGILKNSSAQLTSRATFPRSLVAIQVSFSLAVLFVATLLLSSFERLIRVDPGFATDGVLLAAIDPGTLRDPEILRTAGLQLVERVRDVPGVADASISAWPLFSGGGWISSVRVPGQGPDPVSPPHLPVSPHFFETMRIPILEGRDFEARDSAPIEPAAVVVSQAFVRRYFGGGGAIGRVYERVGQGRPVHQEVIGVVGDVRQDDLRNPAPPMVYVPLRGIGTLQVRAAADPLALRTTIEREVRATHLSFRATEFSLQSALVANTLLRERLLALLSGFFAAVGLLLAVVGLYGVLTYSVARRTREIGIRAALGARPVAIFLVIVTDAALTTGVGIVVGLAGGLYLSRVVVALLYEVHPTDVSSIVLPIMCLLTAACLAALPPARRTSRIDPVVALRSE
jgi:putative ABC transport system permease protein